MDGHVLRVPSRAMVSAPFMDGAEQAGLAIPVLLHGSLIVALSIGLLAAAKPVVPPPTSIDVELLDKAAPEATVPEPSPLPTPAPPAPRMAPVEGPPDEAPAPIPMPAPDPSPAPPVPAPRPAPAPSSRPAPAPVARPAPAPPRPAVARPSPARPTTADQRPRRRPGLNDLGGRLAGLSDRPAPPTARPAAPAPATAAPRAPAGPQVQAALGRVIREQLKPHWRAPTGPDAEQLRTELRVSLARNGTVTNVQVIGTTGINDSNRGQVRLHQEAAIKAVRLASPFSGLPPEYYDAWSVLETVGFDRRLSQ